MLEFGVSNYKPVNSFPSIKQNQFGSKPCFTIIGSEFSKDHRYKITANLIVDFFRGAVVSTINLVGLDHVIVLSVGPEKDTILFRHYAVLMKKSGTRIPKVELQEIGPSMDLVIRRQHLASPDLEKEALRLPEQLVVKKKKNITTTPMGDTVGTVHVHAQNVEKMTAGIVPAKALRHKGGKRKRESEEEKPRKGRREVEA